MNSNNSPNYKYKVGGSLPFNSPTYVVRQADRDLYNGLKDGEFCYILNSRQMGKSSLIVRAMNQLQAEETNICGLIDLPVIGTQVTREKWYYGIGSRLVKIFKLDRKMNFSSWWSDRASLSEIQRLNELIDEILLESTDQKFFIFLDEIDSILNLNFAIDDFFNLIRTCYNKRASQAKYERITFALSGVATPTALMRNENLTPFNIGQAIELTGFKASEISPLVKGLSNQADRPDIVLEEILRWTGGQPFLTQKICSLLLQATQRIPQGGEAVRVEQVVQEFVIENWAFQDNPPHLRPIRDRILNSKQPVRLLGLYQQILQQGELAVDKSPEQMELRLSGLVVEHYSKLRVYNPIYRSIFDDTWVSQQLALLRPYEDQLNLWLASNCQSQSYLLYGQKLQEALTWKEGKNLNERDHKFLTESQLFDRTAQLNLSRFGRYTDILKAIHDWTSGQPNLYQILLKLANKSSAETFHEDANLWIEQLVRSQLTQNWETSEIGKFLQELRHQLLTYPQAEKLLKRYQQILEELASIETESAVPKKITEIDRVLLEFGLIVHKDGKLSIANPIYETAFSRDWLDRTLIDIHPYARAMAQWQASDKQDLAFLLQGENLQKALEWTRLASQPLAQDDSKFLIHSQLFSIRGSLGAEEKSTFRIANYFVESAPNPYCLFWEVLLWTGGDSFLTQKVCQLLLSDESEVPVGQEKQQVEKLVQSRLIESRIAQVNNAPLEEACDRFGCKPERAFELLRIYQQILQHKSIAPDNTPEQQELLQSGLVIRDSQGFLCIANRIYTAIFNQSWVEQVLAKAPPYFQSLAKWVKSNRQDRTLLLRGSDLQAALEWADGKEISCDEEQFLNLSSVWDLPNVQAAIAPTQKDVLEITQMLWDRTQHLTNIANAVLHWTNGDPAMTQIVKKLLGHMDTLSPIPNGEESAWFEELLRSHLFDRWEIEPMATPFRTIRDRLLRHPRAFELLNLYLHIVGSSNPVSATNCFAESELLKLRLIACEQQKLSISNPIYENTFSSRWILGALANLRPYAKPLAIWLAANGRDTSQLLNSKALERALAWSKGKSLNNYETRFLAASQVWNLPQLKKIDLAIRTKAIWAFQSLIEKVGNPLVVIESILSWTSGHPMLTQLAFELIESEEIPPIFNGEEREFVDSFMQKHFIEICEQRDLIEHFQNIRNYILHNPRNDPFQLFMNYRQILKSETIQADDSEVQKELLGSGLVVSQAGYLKVANRMYQAIFGLQWVETTIVELRPYAKQFFVWLDMDQKDCSQLLQGQALQTALECIKNKSLSVQENRFLVASQVWNLRS